MTLLLLEHVQDTTDTAYAATAICPPPGAHGEDKNSHLLMPMSYGLSSVTG